MTRRAALLFPGIFQPLAKSFLEGTELESSELERFESIVLPHLDAAFTLARYLTDDAQDAQDVVQEASLRALKYFGGFRGPDLAARAWFLTIVRNAARTWRRGRKLDFATTAFDEDQHSEGLADDDPAVRFDQEETRERLREALRLLPDEFREVIVLREVQDLSYKEISEVLGVPEGTVMSRLSRARGRLKRALIRGGKERVV